MHTPTLEFMMKLAGDAGALAVAERSASGAGGMEQSFKHGHELVTEADVKVDRLISDCIRAAFPGHRILAEESAPDIGELSSCTDPLWIVDPIDGTVNYAHGHFHSAVSIAFAEQAQIRKAVVFNPFNGELFCAERRQGAFLFTQQPDGSFGERKPLQVARKTDLRRTLFATGFPYHKDDLALLIRRLEVALAHCADLRRIGSAALDICWVAAGRLDIYYENLSVWDFAAAQLIAIEAGAQYGHFQPVPEGVSPVFHNRDILVANPVLFQAMKELLQAADSG